MSLKMKRSLWEEIRSHAEASYPEECCGALIGAMPPDFDKPGRAVEASQARRLENAWEAAGRAHRYQVEPAALARIERESLGTGKGIVGYYHSHPDVPAWPSPFDLMRAWPCYSYLILAVSGEKVTGSRSWVRSEDGRSFGEEPVAIE